MKQFSSLGLIARISLISSNWGVSIWITEFLQAWNWNLWSIQLRYHAYFGTRIHEYGLGWKVQGIHCWNISRDVTKEHCPIQKIQIHFTFLHYESCVLLVEASQLGFNKQKYHGIMIISCFAFLEIRFQRLMYVRQGATSPVQTIRCFDIPVFLKRLGLSYDMEKIHSHLFYGWLNLSKPNFDAQSL